MVTNTLAVSDGAALVAAFDRQFDVIDVLTDRLFAEAELGPCCYIEPESTPGACDGGFACSHLAIVHEISTGLEYCEKHRGVIQHG